MNHFCYFDLKHLWNLLELQILRVAIPYKNGMSHQEVMSQRYVLPGSDVTMVHSTRKWCHKCTFYQEEMSQWFGISHLEVMSQWYIPPGSDVTMIQTLVGDLWHYFYLLVFGSILVLLHIITYLYLQKILSSIIIRQCHSFCCHVQFCLPSHLGKTRKWHIWHLYQTFSA